jgi:hypothetical protein
MLFLLCPLRRFGSCRIRAPESLGSAISCIGDQSETSVRPLTNECLLPRLGPSPPRFPCKPGLFHAVAALDLRPLMLVPNPTFLSWDLPKGNRLPRKRGSRLRYWLHPLRAPNPPSGFLSLYRMQPAIRRPCTEYSRTSEALARLPFGIFCSGPVCQPAYGIWASSLWEASGYGFEASGSPGGWFWSPNVYLWHGAGIK